MAVASGWEVEEHAAMEERMRYDPVALGRPVIRTSVLWPMPNVTTGKLARELKHGNRAYLESHMELWEQSHWQ